jgi:hypothetical protein
MTQTANTRRRFSGTLNFPEPVKRGETALRRADIDWEVQATKLSDLTGKVGGERWTAAVRTDTDEMIGVNGRRHNVIQNSALAELGDAIVQMNDGFAYVGGGSMYGGSKTFLVLSSDKVFHFGQDDDTGTQSVLLVNDFDGNCPIQGIGFVGRYNCMNQMNGLLRRKTGHRLVSVSHTANHTWKLEAAKDTLRALAHEMDDLEVEIQRLLAFELQRGDAALVAAGPAPKADGTNERAITAHEARMTAFLTEYTRPYNQHLDGTALGAVMAAQGIDEHMSRSADRETARINRVIGANFPTMRRVLTVVS